MWSRAVRDSTWLLQSMQHTEADAEVIAQSLDMAIVRRDEVGEEWERRMEEFRAERPGRW